MRTSAALLLALCLITPSMASGASAGRGGQRAGVVGAAGSFGLGLAGGRPTSLTGKYFLDDRLALDFGLDFYRGMGLHADALWHVAQLASNADLSLPLYVGVGVQIATWNSYSRYGWDRHDDGGDFGVRVPFGIGLWLKKVPLEFYLELGPEVWLIHPSASLLSAAGFRFYF